MKWTDDGRYMVRFKMKDRVQKKIYQHREVWEAANGKIPEGYQIDHIDRDTYNNSLDNLRLVTRSQNQHNRKLNKNNTSGYKGVHYHKQRGKWHAEIMINKVRKSLGLHDTAEAAHKAYKEVAKCVQ